MGYIDIIIPLIIGLLLAFNPESIVKANVPDYAKKRKQVRIAGFVLLVVAALYGIVKFFAAR